MKTRLFRYFGFLFFVTWITACNVELDAPTALPNLPVVLLTPYTSPTVVPSTATLEAATPTLFPTATSTPRSHVIKQGEDLGGIAYRYGVTVTAILEANPEVDPYLLTIGATLVIPGEMGNKEVDTVYQPAPAPVNLGPVNCSSTTAGETWCFLVVSNPMDVPVENVIVQINILQDGQNFVKTATTPLNVIQAGDDLPIGIYFDSVFLDNFEAIPTLIAALPLEIDDQRYLTVETGDLQVTIDEKNISAEVTGKVEILEGEASAKVMRVVLAAFDDSGSVAGIKLLETVGEFAPGIPFEFRTWVYSSSGKINQISAWAEARP